MILKTVLDRESPLDQIDCPTATLDQAKTPSSLPEEEGAVPRTGLHTKKTDPPETGRLHRFLRKTLERDDVVIVVRKCCVNVGTVEVKVVHPRPPPRAGT